MCLRTRHYGVARHDSRSGNLPERYKRMIRIPNRVGATAGSPYRGFCFDVWSDRSDYTVCTKLQRYMMSMPDCRDTVAHARNNYHNEYTISSHIRIATCQSLPNIRTPGGRIHNSATVIHTILKRWDPALADSSFQIFSPDKMRIILKGNRQTISGGRDGRAPGKDCV